MPDLALDAAIEEARFDREIEERLFGGFNDVTEASPTPTLTKDVSDSTFTQWSVNGNDKFTPVSATTTKLATGIYEPYVNSNSWGLEKLSLQSDKIYELPDMATNSIMNEIKTFWDSEEKYRKFNLLYKRGIIMHGPPGSGKSVTVKMLISELMKRDGIVISVHDVPLTISCIKAFKRIEPTRNIICIFEDIDEILSANSESVVLSMLDGEHNVDRIVNVATTNYPERLGSRIINRPSRFDSCVYIGMPNIEARKFYLKQATDNTLDSQELDLWAMDSEGLSIAHLRELVAAVYCLGQSYNNVIKRLQNMATKIKVEDEFKTQEMGFKAKTVSSRLKPVYPTWEK